MLDFAGADAERDRSERAVRRRVRVSADDRHTGLRQTQLRPDHVHDALFDVAHRVQTHAELLGVAAQRLDLGARHRVGDRLVQIRGGDVVVLRRQGQVRPADPASGESKTVEGLRTGDLVDQVQVDEEQIRLPLGLADDVIVPDLLG